MKALTLTLAGALTLIAVVGATAARSTQAKQEKTMELGNFSVSLTVKDIKASKAFYEKLDFKEVAGKLEQHWIVLQNGTTTIGLFQGMFEHNVMTFNPGWTKDMETLKDFQDVRELQRTLKARGIKISTAADESTTGPASFMIADPDGNTLLFDQHVQNPIGSVNAHQPAGETPPPKHDTAEVHMKRVTGIGGVFFKAKDAPALQAWYKTHLGIDVQPWGGAAFDWVDSEGKPSGGTTAWLIAPEESKQFAPSKASFMVNYRVEDVHALVKALKAEGCNVLDKIDDSEYGKFAWVIDPEGNKVELWQPPKGQ